jgi:O-antigen/teichoic acid export membrane protein
MNFEIYISKLKNVACNPALSGTFIVTVGVFLGTIFSYLLQIGLGHLLSIEDFGTFNAFLSLSVIFGIPAGAVATSLIKKVAELLAQKNFYALRKLFWSFTRLSLAFGTALSLIFILLNNQVSAYLNVGHTSIVYIFAVFLALSFLNVAPSSYLQGLLRFKAFAFLSLVSQFLRLIIPLGLVYAGFAIQGAYIGLVVVGFLTFLVSLFLLNKNLRMGLNSSQMSADINLADIYKGLLLFSVPVFFISSGISLLNNIDVVMAKHFFTPYDAGIYAGVVTMSKVFLYGGGIVQIVMFPQISHLYASKSSVSSRFMKFFSLQILLIGAGLLCYIFFPQIINTLMFRGKFTDSVPYLPLFSVFVAFYILISFLSMFLLAINKTKAFLFIIPACVLQYLLINLFHNDTYSIIKTNILSAGIACLFITSYVVKSIHRISFNERNGKIPV